MNSNIKSKLKSYISRSNTIFMSVLVIILFASIGAYITLTSSAATADADFNNDSMVNILDLSILASNWSKTSMFHSQGDANADGTVNIIDLSILANYFGQTVSITPTPTGQPANSINVKDAPYSVKGDGTTDDTASLNSAFVASASQSKIAWVPSGTYKFSSLVLPDNLTIQGEGVAMTYLNGQVNFGSNQFIYDLKMGTYGNSTRNKNGANNTLFERVQFRGGGGSAGGTSAPVMYIGQRNVATNITFINCNWECSLGSDPSPFGNCYNCITIQSTSDSPSLVVDGILFQDCHIGVSNGVRSGSLRFGLEVVNSTSGSSGLIKNITLRNCIVEAADAESIDFSDHPNPSARMTGLLIEDCLIKGGGKAYGIYAFSVVFELPYGFIFRNNTVWRSPDTVLKMTQRDETYPVDEAAVITGNNFDLEYDNGIVPGTNYAIQLMRSNVQFTGNTISSPSSGYSNNGIIRLREMTDSTINHNTANILGRTFIFEDKSTGSSGNIITPNTVN